MCVFQFVSLGDEVVLFVDVIEYLVVFQLVGDFGVEQGYGEGVVDEVCVVLLQMFQFFLVVQVVDEVDVGYVDFGVFFQ